MKAMSGETQCWTAGWGQEYEKQNTSFSSERFDINKESIIIGLKRLVDGELKYLFAKHMRRQGLATGYCLIFPFLYYVYGGCFLNILFVDATAERLKAIQDPQGESRGRCCRYPSPDKTFTPSQGGFFCFPRWGKEQPPKIPQMGEVIPNWNGDAVFTGLEPHR